MEKTYSPSQAFKLVTPHLIDKKGQMAKKKIKDAMKKGIISKKVLVGSGRWTEYKSTEIDKLVKHLKKNGDYVGKVSIPKASKATSEKPAKTTGSTSLKIAFDKAKLELMRPFLGNDIEAFLVGKLEHAYSQIQKKISEIKLD